MFSIQTFTHHKNKIDPMNFGLKEFLPHWQCFIVLQRPWLGKEIMTLSNILIVPLYKIVSSI